MTATEVRRASGSSLAFVVTVFLIACNLRASLAGLPPLVPALRESLGLSAMAAGLLTTLPVLCLGIFAPAAPVLVRRHGPDTAISVGLIALAAGLALRGTAAQAVPLYAGTVILGAGIGVVGAALPAMVRSRGGSRAGLATGVYATGMAVGAALGAGTAIPLSEWSGSWTAALGLLTVPALLALVAWLLRPNDGGDRPRVGPTEPAPARVVTLPWHDPIAWTIIGFVAAQSLLFFSQLAWVAPSFSARGWSESAAGALAAGYAGAGIVATAVIPAVSDRVSDRRVLVIAGASCTVTGLVMLATDSHLAPWLAVLVLGFGQTGCFSLGLVFLAAHTPSPVAAAQLTARAFVIGYPLAALGPLAGGALLQAGGGYGVIFTVLALLSVLPVLLLGRLRPGVVTGSAPTRATGYQIAPERQGSRTR